jgi:hypothetical protein
MSRRALVIALLVVSAAGGLTALLYASLERKTERVDRGFTGEARRNPYLAGEYFLRRMGVPSRMLEGPRELDRLPPPDATLLLPTERSTLGPERSRALLGWVEDGGHLIVRIRRPVPGEKEPRDPLLDPLGIGARNLGWENVQAGSTTLIEREGTDDLMEIDFYATHVIDTHAIRPEWEVSDPHGVRLVQIRRGAGRVTVLSDTLIWENDRIGDYDHARLLYMLARQNPGGEVLILRTDDLPPLWRWVWQRVPGVVIAGGLLLLAWLLRAPRRLGPLLPDAGARRRRLLEHVEASGHYLWKRGPREPLVDAAREGLMRRLRRTRPDLAGAPPAQLAARLAEATGLGARTVASALAEGPVTGREAFTRRIQILETLRKRL